MGNLPGSIIQLTFDGEYNQPIHPDVLPKSLKTLKLLGKFNQEIQPSSLPDSLENIVFGINYIGQVKNIPIPTKIISFDRHLKGCTYTLVSKNIPIKKLCSRLPRNCLHKNIYKVDHSDAVDVDFVNDRP